MEPDPTRRFSSRVEDYIHYRPGYPAAVTPWLARACGLAPGARVADIGSGTGILSALLLRFGCEVFGVEPNAGMRLAAERLLSSASGFHSVDGRAEATTLPAGSVDFISAGQAFHWFDPEPARREFQRILAPGGWVVLVWNERLVTGAFLTGYEALLHRHSPEFAAVDHRRIGPGELRKFFGHEDWLTETFPNYQEFDWAGLQGRLLSSSYAPLPGSTHYQPMMDELAAIFAACQEAGIVRMNYETNVFAGRL